jgi:hypothetical protein
MSMNVPRWIPGQDGKLDRAALDTQSSDQRRRTGVWTLRPSC